MSKKFEPIVLKPNEHDDWLNQRNENFGSFTPIEPDKKFNSKKMLDF